MNKIDIVKYLLIDAIIEKCKAPSTGNLVTVTGGRDGMHCYWRKSQLCKCSIEDLNKIYNKFKVNSKETELPWRVEEKKSCKMCSYFNETDESYSWFLRCSILAAMYNSKRKLIKPGKDYCSLFYKIGE